MAILNIFWAVGIAICDNLYLFFTAEAANRWQPVINVTLPKVAMWQPEINWLWTEVASGYRKSTRERRYPLQWDGDTLKYKFVHNEVPTDYFVIFNGEHISNSNWHEDLKKCSRMFLNG